MIRNEENGFESSISEIVPSEQEPTQPINEDPHFELERNELDFRLDTEQIQNHRNATRLAQCRCRRTQPVTPKHDPKTSKKFPTIECKAFFAPPRSSRFLFHSIELYHEFLKVTMKFALWALLLPIGLILGPLALLTSFNHEQSDGFKYLLNILLSLNIVTLLNYWLVKRKQFRAICSSTHKKEGPQHFTLMLYGVSNQSTPQEIATTYLRNQRGWLHRPLQASNFIAIMKKIISKTRELRKTEEAVSVFGAQKVHRIKGFCCRAKFRHLQVIKAEIDELTQLVGKYRAMDDAAGQFQEQNVVFATMENPRHAKQLLWVWRRCKCIKVTGVRAPPPKDVFWENLHRNTFTLQILFIVLTVLFAAGVGIGLFLLQEWQKDTGSSQILLGLLISLIIYFADKASEFFLKIFTRLERHHSLTQAQINFATKLVIFNSLFSIFLPLIVFRQSSQQQTGLLQQVLLSLLIFSFLGPLAYLMNPFFCLRQIKYSCLKSSLRRHKQTFLTLKEAHKLAELDNFQFAKRYAETLIPLFLASFYLAFFPLGAVIAGAGAYFNHVLTVCQWSTINRRPAHLSPRIAKHFYDSLILFPILILLGSVVAFLIIPGFRPQIHIFLMLFFCGLFALLIFVAYKSLSYQILNGARFHRPCARWFVVYFHCHQDAFQRHSTDDVRTEGATSTELPTTDRKNNKHKFNPKDYWRSQNNYPFQDPIYHQTAVLEMLKMQRLDQENKDLISSIDAELRATKSQGFFGAALKQLNRALNDREQNSF